jgi:DNA-binding MarR family transcriptional regulator
MDYFDITRFSETAPGHPRGSGQPPPPRPAQGEKYLGGPIPITWLQTASQLSGKALHVAIALWFTAGLTKSRTVRVSRTLTRSFGMQPDSARRGLKQLERAGLVDVHRITGRSPIVTLLDYSDGSAAHGKQEIDLQSTERDGFNRASDCCR